ncbi:hypothetical protein EJA70_19190 [Pseudomonas sp. PB103]|uniref:hypothetical protein n=1 Tax=Pseudomonas sp. PB103 TaxID=2494698 RepID=UPI00131AE4C1|nr:hypothetical protein [Pseudomonas sp. PB103]KAE9642366.1 hypothetical protein EJA70_19190 [Pseudomonas sp. PB103]
MPYAITDYGWRAVGSDFTEAELAQGESLVEEIPQSLIDAIAAQDLLRETTADLNARTRQATAQVTALQGRIDAINDAIAGDYALPEEVEEKPLRAVMLAEWKKYRVFLGRVTGQPIWPTAPTWPEQPEPYNDETTVARA